MRRLFLAVILVFFQTGPAASQCHLHNCRTNKCSYWTCERCRNNFYLVKSYSRDYCYGCPASCTDCDGYEECSGCNSGYYGPICQTICTGCENSICDKDSGSCTYGCIHGYYSEMNGTCSQCPSRCSQCTSSDSCSQCKNGNYWGTACQHTCDHCSHCSKSYGCSSGCNSGYFKNENTNKGGYVCKPCRSTCTSCTAYDYCQACSAKHWGTACEYTCPNSCGACTSNTACSSCISGYWGSYCQNSCSGCYLNICIKSGGCTSGCKNGYYRKRSRNEYHCTKCLDACKTCSSSYSCSSCQSGFSGSQCQHDCRSCNGELCDSATGECTYICASDQYFKMAGTNTGCFKCPDGCSSCSSASQCTACVTGKWGDQCSQDCLPGCRSCNNNYKCQTCKTGYFSKENSWKCECNMHNCSRRVGNICTECFHNTWYPESNGCCPCSANCKYNECFADGSCTECKDTYYGTNCESRCSTNCKDGLCYRNSSCIFCKYDWYYGPSCSLSCSRSISKCLNCQGLSRDSLICKRCSNDYYANGQECKACSVHCKALKYPKCDPSSGVCNTECDKGWFGERCDINCNVTNCQSCSDEDPNICSECTDGFYSETNSSCTACPSKCLTGTLCNKENGSCSGGCDENWSGVKCNISCPSGCRQCDQFNKSSCSLCKDGLFGQGCEQVCSLGCVIRNKNQTCDKNDGTCKFDCKEGLWGNQCDKQCGNGCSGNKCNRTTGYCLRDCQDTHFGYMCDNQCNDKCNITTGRSCEKTDGYCLNGCQVGWFGGQCNDPCGENCKDNICYRNNGSCSSGCIDGFTGSTCMQALQSAEPPGSNIAAIGGGAGAAVAFLIIAVIVIVFILRRRKTSSKMDTRDGGYSQKRQNSKQADPGPEYSNINEARTEKQETQIPGVTNLLYANAPVRMSDVSEKEEQINVNTIPARPTSEDYLKEEEIDEDDIHVDGSEEPEASGEADNTYYNIGGKRVAVAKLAEYIKHKTQGELFNDFEKLPKGLLKSYKEAKKPKNATKNKYRAIYPYDENRVILLDGGSDYMNASYIDGYNRSKEYIASSGPFQKSYDTTPDFWRMIWQERCETLVMLTKPVEKGQTKCMKYWSEAGESCKFGDIHITCLTEDPYADFTIRILAVTKGGESMNIRHVHFTAWPDKGIPHDVTSMIELRQKVRSLHKDKDSPMIVHCSAGIGRTGTFIVLDMLTYEGEDRGSVDIFGSVAGLRYQRCNMVQTPEQYVYLHHAVLHSLTFDCRSIPGDMFLQTYNKLIETNGGQRTIDKQFQQLQSITEEMTDEDRTRIEKNKALSNKNRKGADIPADENRVRLHENRKPGASDYINAVFINSFRKRRKFIVAQTPLPSTVVDFLSLIHQEKCTCIVSMEEPDIQDKTVKVYWPADNQVVKHGVFKVCCKDSKTTNHYVTKKLSITYHGQNGEESRDVNLFIFTNWPKDSPVPNTSDSLLDLVKTVDVMNRKSETEPPILIHCRTGAERSCLYCAVSVLIEKMEIEHEVSVVNTLRQIKARRILAMSSVEQYKFCHQAVISYLQSFDIYSNFGLKEADA